MENRYIEFEYYQKEYQGSLIPDAIQFNRQCLKASQIIRKRSFGRSDLPEYCDREELKMCTCELAEQLWSRFKEADTSGKVITSEKVGDYSISVKTQTEKEWEEKQEHAIQTWLALTGLFYSGGVHVYER